jgi:hypothetical protein
MPNRDNTHIEGEGLMQKFLAAVLVLLAPLANAQLQARDIDLNGTVDAFYDVQQNISWLADANHYATLGGPLVETYWSVPSNPGYHELGQLRLPQAFSFVESLNVGGVTGWRLPERLVPAGDPTGTRYNCNATACDQRGSWPTELTNMLFGNPRAVNSFVNVMNSMYLTYSAPITPGTNDYVTWVNPFSPNVSTVTDETGLVWGYVWAVHDGDVGAATNATVTTPVPEPETYALMLSALAALVVAQRRTWSKAGSRPA